MLSIRVALVAVIVLLSGVTYAEDQQQHVVGDTVYGLLKNCQITKPNEAKEFMDWVACRSYLAGLRDLASMVGYELQQEQATSFRVYALCGHPKNLPLDADIQVFINWAQQHPEKWSNHKIWALSSFTEKWPCP